jgi:hypothetical protein
MSDQDIRNLFTGPPLNQVMQRRKDQLIQEIDNYNVEYVLGVDEQELCEVLLGKYSLQVPILHEAEQTALPIQDRREQGFGGPVAVTSYTILVPFTGDSALFQYQPSHYSLKSPRGKVKEHELHLYFTLPVGSQNLKHALEGELESIKAHLAWVERDVVPFNESLKTTISDLVTERKRRLEQGEAVLEGLGIPIRHRTNLPEIYTDLLKRESIDIRRSEVKIREALPKEEPFVPSKGYEHILSVISSLSLGIERSPEFFSKQPEEQLRDFFLMFLNVHFEGQATGETFNKGGRTDILIRVDNKNVFIAECKFWAGKKQLIEAIDQLFTYTTWRDTKTAILLFNKNKDYTSVLKQIGSVVASHSCYVGEHIKSYAELVDETVFRYVFHYPEDKDRKILLTVICCDVGQSHSTKA